MELVDRILSGDHRAIARAISLIENSSAKTPSLIKGLFGHTGKGRVIGVTGAPGVGKSTLVDQLALICRDEGKTVGILAIDPTSPFTGGAILGDRIRMQRHTLDEGVYVRSMANQGHLGGLSYATSDAIFVLDAAGFDVVIVETVGVGQGEVEIASTADVSIVVTVPDAGDEVQAMKAGIMEIADIFVVNKSDRPGAERTVAEIEAMLKLQDIKEGMWCPPVFLTEGTKGTNLAAVFDAVLRCDEFHGKKEKLNERRYGRARVRLISILKKRMMDRFEQSGELSNVVDEAVTNIAMCNVDPYAAADAIMERMK